MHLAVQIQVVGAGKPVLGDVNRQVVALPNKARSPFHRLRCDGPADGSAGIPCAALAELRLAVRPGAHHNRVVDVHPNEVRLAQRQGIPLLLRDRIDRALRNAACDFRPATPANRVERRRVGKGPVPVCQRKGCRAGRLDVGGRIGCRGADTPGRGNAHLRGRVGTANGIGSQTVRINHRVPRCKKRILRQPKSRRVNPRAVAKPDAALRFVQGKIVPHAPLKMRRHGSCIGGKRLGCICVLPAALVLQGLRQIPVIQRNIRLYACRKQGIHKAVVPSQPCRVDLALPFRENARPSDGKPVGSQMHRLEQVDILLPAVVAVAGNVPGFPVFGFARRMAEGVPDGGSAPILIHTALDLIGCGRRTPDKIFRKWHFVFLLRHP